MSTPSAAARPRHLDTRNAAARAARRHVGARSRAARPARRDSFVVPGASIGCQVTRRGSAVLAECPSAGSRQGLYGTFISIRTVMWRGPIQPRCPGRLHG
jgi:hypothetical protein